MGSVVSSTDSHNSPPDSPKPNFSSNSASSHTMASSSDPNTQSPELANSRTEAKPIKESDQQTNPMNENQAAEGVRENEGEGQEDEEEGECGFCLFMKGGGCKDVFIDWENCIKEADHKKEDVVSNCFDATAALRKCMQAHADYYEPILKAEKDAEEAAMKELEKENKSETEVESELVSSESEKKAKLDSNDSTVGK